MPFLRSLAILCMMVGNISLILFSEPLPPVRPRQFEACSERGLACHVQATVTAIADEPELAAHYRALDPSTVLKQLVQDARSRMLLDTECPTDDALFLATLKNGGRFYESDEDGGDDLAPEGLRAPDQCAPGAGDAWELWGDGAASELFEAQLLDLLHPRPKSAMEWWRGVASEAVDWLVYSADGAIAAAVWVDENTVEQRAAAIEAVKDGAIRAAEYLSETWLFQEAPHVLEEIPVTGRLASVVTYLFELDCTCQARPKITFRSLWETFIWPPPPPPPKQTFLQRGWSVIRGVIGREPPPPPPPQKPLGKLKNIFSGWVGKKGQAKGGPENETPQPPSSPKRPFWKKVFRRKGPEEEQQQPQQQQQQQQQQPHQRPTGVEPQRQPPPSNGKPSAWAKVRQKFRRNKPAASP